MVRHERHPRPNPLPERATAKRSYRCCPDITSVRAVIHASDMDPIHPWALSTHEDDFVYLVASSLYGDGGGGGDQQSQYSLKGAVLHGFITERRAKHLTK